MMLKSSLALLAALALPASAALSVTFTGGNETPLVMTINQPVTYIAENANSFVVFVIENVGSPGSNFTAAVTGTLTYSINEEAPITITVLLGGTGFGAVGVDDWYFYAPTSGVFAANDTITLYSGTVTTTANYDLSPPPSGTFSTFIADGSLAFLGNAVPEPSTALLGALGAVWCLGSRRRRNG